MTMLDKAFFISDQIHEREVTLGDGSVHKLHFKELTAAEFRKFHLAEQSGDEDKKIGSMARLISLSLCDPAGKLALTYDQAMKIKPGAAAEITNAILAVNGFGAKQGNG